jgi:two-component system cell cycle sensor histidine kinase/response regulator CckA
MATVVAVAEVAAFGREAARPAGYLLALMVAAISSLILNYRGSTRLAGILLPSFLLVLVTFASAASGGLRSPDIWFYPFVILMAGFLHGPRAGLAMGGVCLLTTLTFVSGLVHSPPLVLTPGRLWFLILLGILSAAVFQYLAVDTMYRSLRRASHELQERERAERALAESEESYRTLVSEMGDGVGNVDLQGRSIMANPALEGIFGVGPGELRGRNIREFLQPADLLIVETEMRRRRLGETGRYQVEIVRPDGTRRTIHVTAAPQLNANGEFAGAVTIVRDVTDPSMLEGQIRLLAHALRSAGECIWIADPDGRLVYLNEALQRTFGYEERELLGRSVSVLAAEREADAISGIRPHQLTDGWRGEVWCRASGGNELPMVFTTTRIRDHYGVNIAWVGVGRDVTHEKQAEATLRESERRFREHLEKVQLAAVMMDRNGCFTFCNDYFLQVTGFSRDEIVGTPALNMVAADDLSRASASMDVLREQSAVPLTVENIIITKSGQRRLMQWNNTPLLDSNGDLTGLCGLGVDVTEHRALMEHRQQSERLESVGRLAAGVAHDFNNVLTVINGYSEMALPDLRESDPARRYLVEIRKAGEQAATITRQLLTFSRRQVIEPGPVVLNQVILESESMLTRLLGGRIRLETSLAPETTYVLADKGQLQQVLLNLMTNAIEAMPEGGIIHIQTSRAPHPERQSGEWILLSVSDNGVGMDKETLPHIFEPFFTTRRDGKGTGLGLSIVYGIVQQSNGYVTAESEPGVGTTFRIWWPVANPPPPAANVVEERPAPGSETILVVEDREEVRTLVVAILKAKGYRVLSAANGKAALQIVSELPKPIDLLLTDVVMPGMNGRDLAARVTAIWPAVKVILMSGYAADVIEPENLPDSGMAFIQKPFTPDSLNARVRLLLDSRNGAVS